MLPAPCETENNDDVLAMLEDASVDSRNPSARYEMLESVSFAFLLALELLTPTQRAVLLLLNGLFALITERTDAPEGIAPKRAALFEVDDDGLIRRMYFVLASRKLTALPGLTK